MFQIVLTSIKPITVMFNNSKFDISKIDNKVMEFNEPKDINFDFYFTENGSNIFHGKLKFVDDEYMAFGENLQIVKMKEQQYILRFLCKNECFLQKKCQKIVKNEQIFTFFQNGVVEIETENQVLFSQKYDFEIVNAEISELVNNYFVIKLFGKDEEEKSIVFNNNFAEIICLDSAVIEPTENGFKVLTNLHDVAGHGLVEIFSIDEDIKKIDEYAVYMNNAPNRDFNINILPLYFLQCIKSRDYEEAKRCLSQNLRAKAKIEHLAQYFGEFVNTFVFDNNFYLEYIDAFNHHFAKKYNFRIEANRIQNIE